MYIVLTLLLIVLFVIAGYESGDSYSH